MLQAPALLRWMVVAILLMIATATVQTIHAQNNIECSATVTVQPGDTLSLIAARQSSNQVNYQSIIAATNVKAVVDPSYTAIANPNLLSVGWKLCIPAGSSTAQGATAVAAASQSS